jgi:hypothetical protein
MKREPQQPREISGILNRLRKAPRFEPRAAGAAHQASRATTLGAELRLQEDGRYRIDLSGVRLLTGLPDFARMLAERLFEAGAPDGADRLVVQPVDAAQLPALAGLGLQRVSLFAPRALLARLLPGRDLFFVNLLRVLSSAQNVCPAEAVASTGAPGVALLFSFDDAGGEFDYDILLEYEAAAKLIRLTADDRHCPRLNLKRIPHRLAEERARHLLGKDIGVVAAAIAAGIHRACQDQRGEYTELPSRQPALFALLAAGGLPAAAAMRFHWDIARMTRFLLGQDGEVVELVGKAVTLLEDRAVLDTLRDHRLVELVSGGRRAFLDLSRRDRCLNISLDEHRRPPRLDAYLAQMPRLAGLAKARQGALAGVRVVLVHHFTAEVLGLIQALIELDCAFLQTLFIRYKGITPEDFIEPLLAQPETRAAFHALQQMESPDMLGGMYVPSPQFSSLDGLAALVSHLQEHPADYTHAMRQFTAHLFFQQALTARLNRQTVLLVEDGGYLTPILNRFCLENRTLGEFLAHFQIPPSHPQTGEIDPAELHLPLKAWLQPVMPTCVEHTRNGYDQIKEVAARFDGLAFPAYTIALSKCKNINEARACAYSLILAGELIMNGQTDCLYNRSGLIIGSRGYIGHYILRQAATRMAPGHTAGLDLAVPPGGATTAEGLPEYQSFDDIPEPRFLDLDFILGITGVSVMQPRHLCKLLLQGRRRRIYLASGSTKNVEFLDVCRWIQELRDAPEPAIEGRRISLRIAELRDPLTHINQGTRIVVAFLDDPAADKEIILMADGMPVNFLFYGVPGEIIDSVMCELLQLCWLATRRDKVHALRLQALDVDMDFDGNPIAQCP